MEGIQSKPENGSITGENYCLGPGCSLTLGRILFDADDFGQEPNLGVLEISRIDLNPKCCSWENPLGMTIGNWHWLLPEELKEVLTPEIIYPAVEIQALIRLIQSHLGVRPGLSTLKKTLDQAINTDGPDTLRFIDVQFGDRHLLLHMQAGTARSGNCKPRAGGEG